MKRLGSSDSLGALMTICPSTTANIEENNQVYPRDFRTMLEGFDEEGGVEESGHAPEKKRRLSVDQVKALEKNFEVENKLEPERKVKLAQELGLMPRQVAVWFQNRRARWKTKQLERDYGVLKASYDALKSKYDNLQHGNDALHKEIRELKSKYQDKVEVKDEAMLLSETDTESDHQDKVMVDHLGNKDKSPVLEEIYDDVNATELNFGSFNSSSGVMGASALLDFKDGSSDSDTSAILNEEMNMNNNSPNGAMSSPTGLGILQSPHQFLISNGGGGVGSSSLSSSSSMSTATGFQFADTKEAILGDAHKAAYQPQFVKIEEHNFFSGDETCSTFFGDEQPPTLSHWYSEEEWN